MTKEQLRQLKAFAQYKQKLVVSGLNKIKINAGTKSVLNPKQFVLTQTAYQATETVYRETLSGFRE